jgi:hypothetical protein
MPTYKLIASRNMGKIYVLQVVSHCSSNPAPEEIRNILKTLGFTDRTTLSYASSGNWIVEKIG